MGKNSLKKKYTLSQINPFLLFCIDTDNIYALLDKSTDFILKEGHTETVDKLMEMMSTLNWEQDNFALIRDLRERVVIFNDSNVNHLIASNAYASAALRLIQYGQILPKDDFNVLISVQILLNQISTYHAYDYDPASEKVFSKQFLEFIGQLCLDGMQGSAAAIHNCLHFGYLIAHTPKNRMDEKHVSLILGPSLLDSLEIDGGICKKDQNDAFGTKTNVKEYQLIAEITEFLIKGKYFSKPFDATFYAKHHQRQEDRLRERSNICRSFWEHLKPTNIELLEPVKDITSKIAEMSIEVTNTSKESEAGYLIMSEPLPSTKSKSIKTSKRAKYKKKNKSVVSLSPSEKAAHPVIRKSFSNLTYTPSDLNDDALSINDKSSTFTPSHNHKNNKNKAHHKLISNTRMPKYPILAKRSGFITTSSEGQKILSNAQPNLEEKPRHESLKYLS